VDRNIRVSNNIDQKLVALLAEGVDRNMFVPLQRMIDAVALLAEGVDRNTSLAGLTAKATSRPPRGGRG